MMKIFDISWPLRAQSTEYKNRKTIVFETIKTLQQDNIQETMLHFHAHSGTHIDLPAHVLKNERNFKEILLENLVSVPAIVLDVSQVQDRITKKDLETYEHLITKGSSILLKTKNSQLASDAPFTSNFVYLADDGATYLAKKEISLVGIDYVGIERNQPGHPTHKVLLQHNVIIVEGLRLQGVKEGNYIFTCLPLSCTILDALPARAILQQML